MQVRRWKLVFFLALNHQLTQNVDEPYHSDGHNKDGEQPLVLTLAASACDAPVVVGLTLVAEEAFVAR